MSVHHAEASAATLPPHSSIAASLAPLVDRDDLAELFRVSTATVRTWEQQGRLPRAVRVGRKPYWSRDVIAAFLNAGGAPTPAKEAATC